MEVGGSAGSSVTARPSRPGSPVSSERPVSRGQVAEPRGRSLWEQICEEYEAELPPFPEEYKMKQEPSVPVLVTPLEEFVPHGFNTEHYLPMPHFPVMTPVSCPQMKPEIIEPKTCSPRDYLELFIFPVLLPGMANLLHQAKKENVLRKRTKFIACDFLTEWLYNQNPKRIGEPVTEFFSIPFVEEWLKNHSPGSWWCFLRSGEGFEPSTLTISINPVEETGWPGSSTALPVDVKAELNSLLDFIHSNPEDTRRALPGILLLGNCPRPPIPLSLLLTEEEAAISIQSFWRAYLVRCDPEIQELRQWQKKLREDKHIRQRVKIFWTKQEQKLKCKMEDEEVPAATVPPP